MRTRKVSLAVHKFASCDGCQLSLLDCEDELLAVADAVDIAYWPEATRRMLDGPWDVSLVEGSITTPHDAERIRRIRALSGKVISIGACATAGGIQALRNCADIDSYIAQVYATPGFISTLAHSTPIAAHIEVDFELRGCPVDKGQFLEVLTATVHGRPPAIGAHTLCLECKIEGQVCVTVAHGVPCLGPVTHSGCGALCPRYTRGCFGCFGPGRDARSAAMTDQLIALGQPAPAIERLWRGFTAADPRCVEQAERVAAAADNETTPAASATAPAVSQTAPSDSATPSEGPA